MNRRACIEFKGRNTITVTTFCNQKTFDLNTLNANGKALDLVTLKPCSINDVNDDKVPFSAVIIGGDGSLENPYELYIYARTSQDMWAKEIGWMDFRSKMEVFSVTLPD